MDVCCNSCSWVGFGQEQEQEQGDGRVKGNGDYGFYFTQTLWFEFFCVGVSKAVHL